MVLRKSFYIRWSAGRSPRVHEVNPGRDPSFQMVHKNLSSQWRVVRLRLTLLLEIYCSFLAKSLDFHQ